MRCYLKARVFQGVFDLCFPAVYDAGGDENGLVRHEAADMGRKRYYNVGNDVCKHDIISAAEVFAERFVTDNVAGKNSHPVPAYAVERGVFHDDVGRLGVDVTADAAVAPEHQRAYAEDAAAAAEIEHLFARSRVFFKRGKAHTRGRMAAGAEHEPRVESEIYSAPGRRFLPLGNDEKTLSYLKRLVEFLPVILPIAVAHGLCAQVKLSPERGKHFLPVPVVLKVALYPRQPRVALLQRLVNIVPVAAVVLKKILEIGLVFNDKAAASHGGQPVADRVDILRRTFYRNFRISHITFP